MPDIEAVPADQIKRPTSVTMCIKDMVERLEPTRHQRTVEYQFSNGRRFRRLPDYQD